jgi:hypothetical protein
MRTYRLYFRDPRNGHIVDRCSFEAQGDLAAIQTAATMRDGRPADAVRHTVPSRRRREATGADIYQPAVRGFRAALGCALAVKL